MRLADWFRSSCSSCASPDYEVIAARVHVDQTLASFGKGTILRALRYRCFLGLNYGARQQPRFFDDGLDGGFPLDGHNVHTRHTGDFAHLLDELDGEVNADFLSCF